MRERDWLFQRPPRQAIECAQAGYPGSWYQEWYSSSRNLSIFEKRIPEDYTVGSNNDVRYFFNRLFPPREHLDSAPFFDKDAA